MADRAFVDLHCHTSASFDSLAAPASIVGAAVKRGLTHLAITDHGTIDGALEARAAAPEGLTIIVGEEIRTAEGDLIALFLQTAVAQHRPATETIEEVRAQGGLVGVPHPFDKFRGSLLRDAQMASLAPLVDWVEVHNARIVGGTGNEQAVEFASEHVAKISTPALTMDMPAASWECGSFPTRTSMKRQRRNGTLSGTTPIRSIISIVISSAPIAWACPAASATSDPIL